MTNNGYINKIVDLQIALYEIRRSKPDYFSKELPKRKEELKPKIKLDVVIEHISFKNYSDLVAKMENYSNLASKELFKKNIHVSAITPISHGLWMFVKTYFIELGILDGFDGFIISTMNAGGSFLKYAKFKEAKEYERNNA